MNSQIQQQPTKQRIDVIDALRGFALMLICLIHNELNFLINTGKALESLASPLGWLDHYFYYTTVLYAAGKGYAIFSILFGFTFSLQYQNYLKKGHDFGYRYLWRMVLLAGFGLFNSLLYPGDIFLTYAILGILLFLTRKLNDTLIICIAIFLLTQPLEWLYILSPSMNKWAIHNQELSLSRWAGIIRTIREGDFLSIIKNNLLATQIFRIDGLLTTPRSTQSAGLLFIGVWLHRKKLFITSPESNKFWIYTLICSSLLLISTMHTIDSERIDTILSLWRTLIMTAIMVSSFILLYQNAKIKKALSGLNVYGKMAMTNYTTQSFLGAIIYYPVGLNLAPKCNATTCFFIGVAMVTVQIYFCKWWLKTHKQGPLESIWHKLTWLGKK